MGTALLGSLLAGRVTADLPHQLTAHGIPAAVMAPTAVHNRPHQNGTPMPTPTAS
ncbi:hypothetical protein AB0D91_01780 [Streptomyces canus]|uniref:hypothetical protein n=1 Tax=Streptomyces canus TaxID=58343 RepID=UPI0033D56916